VEDAAEGILLATERYEASAPINLGSGMEISIKDLVHLIAHVTGFEAEIRWDTAGQTANPGAVLMCRRPGRYSGSKQRQIFVKVWLRQFAGISKSARLSWMSQHGNRLAASFRA
jgi:GDP-L-fucose synthase